MIAATQGDAFNALREVSQKLVNRVDKRLTANLFLMSEHTPEDSPEPEARSPPSWRKLGSELQAAEEVLGEAAAEAPEEAKARWLGLFDSATPQTPRAKSPGASECCFLGGGRGHLLSRRAWKSISCLSASTGGRLAPTGRASSLSVLAGWVIWGGREGGRGCQPVCPVHAQSSSTRRGPPPRAAIAPGNLLLVLIGPGASRHRRGPRVGRSVQSGAGECLRRALQAGRLNSPLSRATGHTACPLETNSGAP